MIGLALLLFEQWDEIEADFQRYYTLDLRAEVLGVTRAEVTLRRLNALVLGLPAESSLWRTRLATQQNQSREPWAQPDEPRPRKRIARLDEIMNFFGANMAR